VPRGVFAHGWLLVGGEKMSKSKLTGIAPTEITDVFGSDAYRFYFLSAIAFGQDGSFSWEDLSARYQAELANGFGNLASRTTAMIEKYFEGIVPPPPRTRRATRHPEDRGGCRGGADAAMERFRPDEAIAAIWTIVDALNGYITENAPGRWRRTTRARPPGHGALHGRRGLRALAVLLSPVMPRPPRSCGSRSATRDASGPADSRGGRLGRARPRNLGQRPRPAVPPHRAVSIR
jgi:methionyl-tRNA synthetase